MIDLVAPTAREDFRGFRAIIPPQRTIFNPNFSTWLELGGGEIETLPTPPPHFYEHVVNKIGLYMLFLRVMQLYEREPRALRGPELGEQIAKAAIV